MDRNIIHLQCLGHIDGPRWLNGDTKNGGVNLKPNLVSFSGTRWEIVKDRSNPLERKLANTSDDKESVVFVNRATAQGPVKAQRWDGKVIAGVGPTIDVRILSYTDYSGRKVKYDKMLSLPAGKTLSVAIPAQSLDARLYIPDGHVLLNWKAGEGPFVVDDELLRGVQFEIATSGRKPLLDRGIEWYAKSLEESKQKERETRQINRERTGHDFVLGNKVKNPSFFVLWTGTVIDRTGASYKVRVDYTSGQWGSARFQVGDTYDFLESELSLSLNPSAGSLIDNIPPK